MAVCGLLGIVIPFALAWWMVKKYHVRPLTILVGAGVFIVFALGLESVVHQVVLKGSHGSTILGNTWYYALYGGLMAGLFEETGRFLAMKYLLRREPSEAKTAVGYGVGHGGVEMLVLYGITLISYVVMSLLINAGQADTLLSGVPAEGQEQVQAQLDQLQTAGAGSYLLGLWERASALLLQLGLSLMVWTAVRKGGKWLWLFPAAILLHFLVDACAVVLAKYASTPVVETVVSALAIAYIALGWLVSKKPTALS